MGTIGKLGRWMAGTALGLGIVLMPIVARADGATTAVGHCSLEMHADSMLHGPRGR